MVKINIPKTDLPVFKKIAEFGAKEFDSLASGLRSTAPTFSRKQFAHNVSEKVKNIRSSEIAAILRVVFILYSMHERVGVSAQELARDVAESYADTRSKDNHFPAAQVKSLGERLKTLLSINDTVAVTAKAFDVMTEHKHTYCRARILSDIRPVFTNSTESASAAVIIHNLQIGYHDGGTGEHREFYVALDTDDIQALKEVVERAEKKTKALESILKRAKTPYLKV